MTDTKKSPRPPTFRKTHLALAIAALPLLMPMTVVAVPVGSEFQVNTYTSGSQGSVAVAMDADGDFVAVWTSYGQDGSGNGIYAQRYNVSGVAQGSEFLVNTYTSGNQTNAAVAMDDTGNFVVTWDSANQDGSSTGIFGQRFNASGVAQGSEFQVNTVTSSAQSLSRVAMDADGDFVVIWGSSGQDGNGYGVYGQRFNAAGVAQGGEFQVNTYTSSTQGVGRVAMDTDGDFVVTWNSNGQDGSSNGVYGQRFNASGVAQGSEFLVNTYTSGSQGGGAPAMDASGNFVVTWVSSGQDGNGNGVYAQRYDAAGVAQGSEFLVNTYTSGSQTGAAAAMDDDGDFVITWQSNQDGSSYGIYGQRYTAAGAKVGGEFQVNTYTSGSQSAPLVAMDSTGNFVVAWASNGQDGNGNGVYGQVYDPTLDTTPDAFDFIDRTSVPRKSVVYSDIVTLSGFDSAATAITGGAYRIYSANTATWGTWTKAAGSVGPGDKVQLRTTSDTTLVTDKTVTLTAGTATVDWLVRTEAADTVPDAFTFIDKTNQLANRLILSQAITPTGVNSPVAISISGDIGSKYRVYSAGRWGTWTGLAGTSPAGAKVQVRVPSAVAANTTTSATLTIGGISDSFDVTTAP